MIGMLACLHNDKNFSVTIRDHSYYSFIYREHFYIVEIQRMYSQFEIIQCYTEHHTIKKEDVYSYIRAVLYQDIIAITHSDLSVPISYVVKNIKKIKGD